MQKIMPCLWFDGQAEEAAEFYTTLFKNSKIGHIVRYGEVGAQLSGQKQGSVMTIEFNLEEQKIVGLNGGPHFKFTPALSFFVCRKSEKDIDDLWQGLSSGGEVRMELGKYPWAEKYGWISDKYGVDWQLMFSADQQKITPAFLFVQNLFGKGEEALNFYSSLFDKSKIDVLTRDESGKYIRHCAFTLNEQNFVLMEGEGTHNFTFSPAFSFIVNCETQEEIDKYWNKLSIGDSNDQCGWVKDKYGISWQIVPAILGELMSDPKKKENIMKALMSMKKIDIEKLKQIYNQD